MNIFVLDESPILSAQWQHDRHVVKMILESAQMLSTAIQADSYVNGFAVFFDHDKRGRLYKPTHVNHPCNVWLRESWGNFAWLACHLDGLLSEYHFRFQKPHATDPIRWIVFDLLTRKMNISRSHIKVDGISTLNPAILRLAETHTPFKYCGDGYFMGVMGDNVVAAYRAMYASQKIFQDHVKWTRRPVPDFLTSMDRRFPKITLDRISDLVRQNESQQRQPIAFAKSSRVVSEPRVATPSRGPAIRFGIKSV